MRVGIIGAGSIGLLFAAYISRVMEVTIYTRTPEQAADINNYGIVLKKGTEQTISVVKALPINLWQGTDDITMITVKQYQLNAIIEEINQLETIPDNLLFLQNGMGHLRKLKNLQASNLFVGSVEHGALKENSYTVSHNGEGTTNVAGFRGNFAILNKFVLTTSVDFPVVLQMDYYEMLLNKLIVNAVINPLTAILQVKNGELITNHYYFSALTNLYSEISSILNLENAENHLQQIITICKNTGENRSSMLKDIEANRLTEVDAILGYILEVAVSKGLKASQVENLFYLIKGKELIKGAFT
ncbi:MAG: 2-dehydropantoate 2-reductase [Bacillus sp. (in: Bacteria)]|nr:2-dehydropantoate 2-reductase [Bacillus sp. (in: firmicutes)]